MRKDVEYQLKSGVSPLLGTVSQSQPMNTLADFKQRIAGGGYCIGCGACVGWGGSQSKMILRDGCYEPEFSTSDASDPEELYSFCPFGGISNQEDVISSRAFVGAGYKTSKKLGRYLKLYGGHVKDDAVRLNASSGGVARWLLSELLVRGMVDKVVQVGATTGEDGILYKYQIYTDPESVLKAAKSAYYPVEMSEVLREIRTSGDRFAITAVPCFAKTLKAAVLRDEELRKRLPFIIGLFCGHLKSAWYAQSVAWSEGIHPDELRALDFRGKNKERAVADKEYQMMGADAHGAEVRRNQFEGEAFGTDWGQGLLKYSACDHCDDVAAENADVTVGDVWLPEYMKDWRGSSLLVVRSHELLRVLNDGMESGDLALRELSERQVISSQDAGFRHRRQGLALRLGIKAQSNEWFPPKRTKPVFKPDSNWEKRLFELRMKLTKASFDAFRKALREDMFPVYRELMLPLMQEYEAHYKCLPFYRRVLGKLRRIANAAALKWDSVRLEMSRRSKFQPRG
jgi:coenzyme F420-reducing hydrogenase beta subunit